MFENDIHNALLNCEPEKLDLPNHHAILTALEHGDENMVGYIITKGAKLKVKDDCRNNPYDYAYIFYERTGDKKFFEIR